MRTSELLSTARPGIGERRNVPEAKGHLDVQPLPDLFKEVLTHGQGGLPFPSLSENLGRHSHSNAPGGKSMH